MIPRLLRTAGLGLAAVALLGFGGCAKQLQRIESGVNRVSRDQDSQRRTLEELQSRIDDLAARDVEREQQVAERRAELESQLLALDRAVRQMDARSEEQAELLQQIRDALDIIARQRAADDRMDQAGAGASSTDDAGADEGSDSFGQVETSKSGPVGDASPGTDVYDTAFADYTRGSYTLARQGFQELLDRFPRSELADDAAYWIAETYYAQGDPQEALSGFQSILEEYPRGDSITPSLLKIGYCYLELENEEAARESFRRLVREFPESDEALIAEHKLSTLPVGTGGGR